MKARIQDRWLSFWRKTFLKKSPKDLTSLNTREKIAAIIRGIQFIRINSRESPVLFPSGKHQRITCPTINVARRAVSAYQIATDFFEINLLIFPPLRDNKSDRSHLNPHRLKDGIVHNLYKSYLFLCLFIFSSEIAVMILRSSWPSFSGRSPWRLATA